MDSYSTVRVPEKLPFSRGKLPRKIVLSYDPQDPPVEKEHETTFQIQLADFTFPSYISDYLILLILFGAFEALNAIEPFHQNFSLLNYNIQYPYAVKERVPIWLAIIIAVVCPALIITFYTIVLDGLFSHHKTSSLKRGPHTISGRLWELNCGILGLLLASGTAFVITNAMKNATGKPRPDFIDRCQPIPGSADAPVFGLSNVTICTQTDSSILKDGFRSFPSGHSSSSFAGLFYLTLYLSGKLHLWDTRGFVWKTFLVILPTLGAALIAISRIEDSRHHPFDVLFGSALGMLCAWGSYRQYFPPLSEPWRKGRAYPIRSWGSPSEEMREDMMGATSARGMDSSGMRRRASGHKPLPSDDADASDLELHPLPVTVSAAPYAMGGLRRGGEEEDTSYHHSPQISISHAATPSEGGGGGGGGGGGPYQPPPRAAPSASSPGLLPGAFAHNNNNRGRAGREDWDNDEYSTDGEENHHGQRAVSPARPGLA